MLRLTSISVWGNQTIRPIVKPRMTMALITGLPEAIPMSSGYAGAPAANPYAAGSARPNWALMSYPIRCVKLGTSRRSTATARSTAPGME